MTDSLADGWKTYHSRRNRKKLSSTKSKPGTNPNENNEAVLVSSSQRNQLKKRITSHIYELKECLSELHACLIEMCPPSHLTTIICYGIGSIVNSHESRCQLALLMALREKLMLNSNQACFVYDPVLSDDEYDFLSESFNFQKIISNEECKRRVIGATLFFMPHLDAHLYENLLRANWTLGEITNVLIIGNSFRYIIESVTHKEAKKKFEMIGRASSSPLWREFPLVKYDVNKYESSFNQLVLQGTALVNDDNDRIALAAMVQTS